MPAATATDMTLAELEVVPAAAAPIRVPTEPYEPTTRNRSPLVPAASARPRPRERLVAVIPADMRVWTVVQPSTGVERRVVTFKDAARCLGVHWRSIYRWAADGWIETCRMPNGTRRVYVDTLFRHNAGRRAAPAVRPVDADV